MIDPVDDLDGALRWYTVHTHPRQEERAESNLMSWQIETFIPRHQTGRPTRRASGACKTVRPLFPRYIFARFSLRESLHRVRYARGVSYIVSMGSAPIPVDDHIIDLIKSRRNENGLISLYDDLKPGDEVLIKEGQFVGLTGVFKRSLKDSDRVVILLKTITYQAHIELPREYTKKADRASDREMLTAAGNPVGRARILNGGESSPATLCSR